MRCSVRKTKNCVLTGGENKYFETLDSFVVRELRSEQLTEKTHYGCSQMGLERKLENVCHCAYQTC